MVLPAGRTNEIATNREELGYGMEEDEKSKAEERTDLSLSDWGSPCLLGGGVRGEGVTSRKWTDRHRGEGRERRCAERRDKKPGAKTHWREHNNNNNTNNNNNNIKTNRKQQHDKQIKSSMIQRKREINHSSEEKHQEQPVLLKNKP